MKKLTLLLWLVLMSLTARAQVSSNPIITAAGAPSNPCPSSRRLYVDNTNNTNGQYYCGGDTNWHQLGSAGGAVTLDTVGGLAATATNTFGAGFSWTMAGAVTTVASAVTATNANSTNNNASTALTVSTTGTSTGAIPLIVNQSTSSTGDIADFQNNAVNKFSISSAGILRINASATGQTSATALTLQSGLDATATQGALTLKGGFVNSTANNSLSGGALVAQGGDNAGTGTGETAGAGTFRGGDLTAAAGNTGVSGSVTLRGGDNAGTGNPETAGSLTLRGGNITSTCTTSCTAGTVSITGGGITGAITNFGAPDLTVAAGLGTGTAAVSHVLIKSPALSPTSGSAAQTQVTRETWHTKAGSTTSATPTTVFNVSNPINTTYGVVFDVHVEVISSTPNVCTTTQTFYLSGTNNNGAFGTVNITSAPATPSTLCSTGTLTLAATATAANPSVVSITPTWATITSVTSVNIVVHITNLSQNDIALL